MSIKKWPLKKMLCMAAFTLALLSTLLTANLFAVTVVRLTTWVDGDVLSAGPVNAEFDNLVNAWSSGITITNIDTTKRFRFDTLDVTRGLRWGGVPSAPAGNVFWGNGYFYIGVSKDSAGIIDKTTRQTITKPKVFTDSLIVTGVTALGFGGSGGEVTVASHAYFTVAAFLQNVIPTLKWHVTNKWYVDSLHAIDTLNINTLDVGQTVARDSIQTLTGRDTLLTDAVDSMNIKINDLNATKVDTTRFKRDSTFFNNTKVDTARFKADSVRWDGLIVARLDTTRWKTDSVYFEAVFIDTTEVKARVDTTRFKTDSTRWDGLIVARLDTTRFKTDSVFFQTIFIDTTEVKARKDTTSFKADSAAKKTALDSINTNVTATTRLDTLLGSNLIGDPTEWEYGTAVAITRPGMFYKRTTTKNQWAIADTSVSVRACGLAMDSVAAGAVFRIMIKGKFRKDTWKWTPGVTLYSDSATAGEINVGGQAAPKKMQIYGEASDSNVVNVDIVKTLAY